MKRQLIIRSNWAMPTSLLIIFALVGCQPPAPTQAPAATSMPEATLTEVSATAPESASPTAGVESTATPPPNNGNPIQYQDDFTNKGSGWPTTKIDTYLFGYHEPDWYEVEVDNPNTTVPIIPVPQDKKYSLGDATIELDVNTFPTKTAPDGDFRYGLVFRRSGDNYYAFTISQPTKKWYLLKNSSTGSVVLREGSEESIHNRGENDHLRVDAKGPDFFLSINGRQVSQVTDPDYTEGQIGFYVRSIDSKQAHIHFDQLIIRDFEAPPPGSEFPIQYQDDFTNKGSGWPTTKIDTYLFGYHEPDWYEVEVDNPNTTVPIIPVPQDKKYSLGDATIELDVNTFPTKTAPDGDFRYGLVFRRSGDNYYAFTISQPTKKWYLLKNSSTGPVVLGEGSEESIHNRGENDHLRVDAKGPDFFLSINGRQVSQVTDPDYTEGQIGFYVRSIDSKQAHIHFDQLIIRDLALVYSCTINGGTVNVRSGPGMKYSQIELLSNGDTVKALGIGPNQWIAINLEGSDKPGWVSYPTAKAFMSCTPTVDVFPIVSP